MHVSGDVVREGWSCDGARKGTGWRQSDGDDEVTETMNGGWRCVTKEIVKRFGNGSSARWKVVINVETCTRGGSIATDVRHSHCERDVQNVTSEVAQHDFESVCMVAKRTELIRELARRKIGRRKEAWNLNKWYG